MCVGAKCGVVGLLSLVAVTVGLSAAGPDRIIEAARWPVADVVAVQPVSGTAARIDAFLSGIYKPDQPGAAIIAVKDGKVVFRKGYGLAEVELGMPIRPEMVFRIGSVTKQFTATAVMMLVEEGKLALDDQITKWLPDYPTGGARVTIEHLLTHTSGIKSYTNMPQWRSLRRKDFSESELIDLFKNEPAEFKPGERWAYNNSAYFLLGAIIHKASGVPYDAFVKSRIFDLLGMTDTRYGDVGPIIKGRVAGYERDGGQLRNAEYLSMSQPGAAGALVSSVDDLAKWDEALYGERLLKRSSLARMFTSYRLLSGRPTGYGYGWGVGVYEGRPVHEHGGGINGFACDVIRMPADLVYVAVLSNTTAGPKSPGFVARSIAAMVIGKPIAEPVAAGLEPTALKALEGVYRGDLGVAGTVRAQAAGLAVRWTGVGGSTRTLTLVPVAGGRFGARDSTVSVSFTRDAAGAVTGMSVSDWTEPETATKTGEPLPAERKVAKVDPALYDAYVGEYELRPGFVLTMTRDGDRLMSQATGQSKVELFPASEREFFLKVVDAQVTFVRDQEGRVTGLVLHQNGRDTEARKIR